MLVLTPPLKPLVNSAIELGKCNCHPKLAQSVTQLARIRCLKGASTPPFSIAQTVEAMKGTYRTLLQVVENAALLIYEITELAQEVK